MPWLAKSRRCAVRAALLAGVTAGAAPAAAGTGDIYRVVSERANLRSAPGDQPSPSATARDDKHRGLPHEVASHAHLAGPLPASRRSAISRSLARWTLVPLALCASGRRRGRRSAPAP